MFSNTLAYNGPNRHDLLPRQEGSTCNSEVIFNAGTALASHHRQLSVAVRGVYSSSSKLLMCLFQSSSSLKTRCYVKVHNVQPIKKPLKCRGYSIFANSPHLAEYSAGIGTFPATLQEGCRASTGRFPQPLLMRADLTAHIELL